MQEPILESQLYYSLYRFVTDMEYHYLQYNMMKYVGFELIMARDEMAWDEKVWDENAVGWSETRCPRL